MWGNITIMGQNVSQVVFKNSALFNTCNIKIDGTTADHAISWGRPLIILMCDLSQ